MSVMLDVLTIVSPLANKGWLTQCRMSVVLAASRAGYPVRHIETDFVDGSVGAAMAAGVARSTAEYVAWVDDDDFVLPNAFACLAHHFEARPPAVCAREINVYMNGAITFGHQRHHLTAWRRDVLEAANLAEHPAYPLVQLLKAVSADAVDELSWVYVRRRRKSGGMQVRNAAR